MNWIILINYFIAVGMIPQHDDRGVKFVVKTIMCATTFVIGVACTLKQIGVI